MLPDFLGDDRCRLVLLVIRHSPVVPVSRFQVFVHPFLGSKDITSRFPEAASLPLSAATDFATPGILWELSHYLIPG